uniref:BCAS3 domain-containing protein n=1 Tax=Macrostomum lignano TaxID=282301 RepID=A0A1I8FIY0_9PLAT
LIGKVRLRHRATARRHRGRTTLADTGVATGKDCNAMESSESNYSAKWFVLLIQTTDRIEDTSDNFCRPASIVIDVLETDSEPSSESKQAKPSSEAAFTDSVGSHLLARQFSNDLSIGLADCPSLARSGTKEAASSISTIRSWECAPVSQAELHRNMSSTQLAGSQLSITYFTDSTDCKGKTVEEIPEMNCAFRNGMSTDTGSLAF